MTANAQMRGFVCRTTVLLAAYAWLPACPGLQLVEFGDAGAPTAPLVTVSSATAQAVPAPDYSLRLDGLILLTNSSDIVLAATGAATLTPGSVAGQRLVIVAAAGLSSYAAIDSAFLAHPAAAVALTVPAADFSLEGADLSGSAQRTLIIAHEVSEVRSYQLFEITFRAVP